jgi:hypothetical protein
VFIYETIFFITIKDGTGIRLVVMAVVLNAGGGELQDARKQKPGSRYYKQR